MDIICLSSIDWDFNWQGHQEIMSSLAAQGHRILFVENTGVRSPGARDLPRIARRLRNWRLGDHGFRRERDNLWVYAPLILPFPYSRAARPVNTALLVRQLRRWMAAHAFESPVLWTFLPTPLALSLIGMLSPAVSVYYCIDDLASSSRQAERIRFSEAEMLRRADLVFVTSERLRERALRHRATAHLLPFGVAFDRFDRVRRAPASSPEDIEALPRPRIGYVGGVHKWIDQELLASLASSMPEASFPLIGPIQTDVSLLARHGNVFLLGPRSHAELPRYIQAFDAGLVPYRLTEYTAHVYPTKLNEYLAMGIPVVATDLLEIQRFNAETGDLIGTARDAEEFRQVLLSVLEQDSEPLRERRIRAARENAWAPRIAGMSRLVEAALAPRNGC